MRLQRRLVAVDFVKIIDILVPFVLQHIEPQAARLVPFGPLGIRLDRREKALARLWLHPDFDPNRQHSIPLFVTARARRQSLWRDRAGVTRDQPPVVLVCRTRNSPHLGVGSKRISGSKAHLQLYESSVVLDLKFANEAATNMMRTSKPPH
jgi:hypothetical protein